MSSCKFSQQWPRLSLHDLVLFCSVEFFISSLQNVSACPFSLYWAVSLRTLMPISNAISPQLILRLPWIRWSIWILISINITINPPPPHPRTPYNIRPYTPCVFTPFRTISPVHTVSIIMNWVTVFRKFRRFLSPLKWTQVSDCYSLAYSSNAVVVLNVPQYYSYWISEIPSANEET